MGPDFLPNIDGPKLIRDFQRALGFVVLVLVGLAFAVGLLVGWLFL